jgi:hypothetical protein
MLHISIFQGHTYFGPQVEEAEIHSFTWPEAVGICKLSWTKSSEGSRFISVVRSQGSTCGTQRYTLPKFYLCQSQTDLSPSDNKLVFSH